MWLIAFMAIAALGVDVVVHVAAMGGWNPQDWVRPEWVGLAGFWVVFAVVILSANVVEEVRRRRAKGRGEVAGEADLAGWVRWVIRGVIVYSFVMLAVYGIPCIHRGDPVEAGAGNYVLDPGHGHMPTPITKREYDDYRREGVKAVSGFVLMAYLAVACDMLALAMGRVRDGGGRERRAYWRFVIWRRRVSIFRSDR